MPLPCCFREPAFDVGGGALLQSATLCMPCRLRSCLFMSVISNIQRLGQPRATPRHCNLDRHGCCRHRRGGNPITAPASCSQQHGLGIDLPCGSTFWEKALGDGCFEDRTGCFQTRASPVKTPTPTCVVRAAPNSFLFLDLGVRMFFRRPVCGALLPLSKSSRGRSVLEAAVFPSLLFIFTRHEDHWAFAR